MPRRKELTPRTDQQANARQTQPVTAPEHELANWSDADLAKAVARQNKDAAQALVMRYQRDVRGFLLSLCRDPYLADDLAQETFVRMLRHAESYDPQYRMKTWLFTIARRLLINHARKHKRESLFGEFPLGQSSEAGPYQVAAKADQRGWLKRKLQDAMLALTETQRRAIELFHGQNLSVQEVAVEMQVPVGTVKSHLHRARSSMREVLQGTIKEDQRS